MLRFSAASRVVLAAVLCATVLGPRQSSAADSYELTAIVSLTGVGAFVGTTTQQGLQALELYVNKNGGINGQPVKFIFEDDQTNPQTAVQLANDAIAKKPAMIFGGSFGSTCGAILPIVAKDGPVDYCLSPALRPPPGSYVFSASTGITDTVAVSIKYLRALGLTRIAAITTTDASGQEADRAIDAAFAADGGALVAREHFNPADLSVTAQLARIKAAHPQALIAWAAGTPAATAFRGIQDVALNIPVVTSNANSTHVQMKQYAAFLPKELYFPNPEIAAVDGVSDAPTKAAQKVFFDAMAAIGVKPDVTQSTPWDPGLQVIQALRTLGTGATAAQMHDYLANLQSFTGVNGRYDFKAYPQRGLGESGVIMVRWDPVKSDWFSVSKPGGVPIKR
jgi:branched-chain amino acid transport system substrate-binding protein